MSVCRSVGRDTISLFFSATVRPSDIVPLARSVLVLVVSRSSELSVGGYAVGYVDGDAVVVLAEGEHGGEARGVGEVVVVPVGLEEGLLPGRLGWEAVAPGRGNLDVVVAEDGAFAEELLGPDLAPDHLPGACHGHGADVDVVQLGHVRHGHPDATRHHGPAAFVVDERDLHRHRRHRRQRTPPRTQQAEHLHDGRRDRTGPCALSQRGASYPCGSRRRLR
mmetsp:Transcript_7016/g.22920  ORF Transcript_7016/g.22920 Transcript_7016/m.22920 type:complete len:221 (-) Transcript_7016:696-1358(-)